MSFLKYSKTKELIERILSILSQFPNRIGTNEVSSVHMNNSMIKSSSIVWILSPLIGNLKSGKVYGTQIMYKTHMSSKTGHLNFAELDCVLSFERFEVVF